MDYEKKYKEAIKRAKEFLFKGVSANEDPIQCVKNFSEFVFPELKESENEKIRKWLVSYIKACPNTNFEFYGGVGKEAVLSYLERLSKVSKVEEAMREVVEKAKAFTEAHKGETSEEILAQMKGEQKIIIPKFRVGDTIRPKGSLAEYTIENISGECYHGKGWALHVSADNDYELVDRSQSGWKPTEEQLEALRSTVEYLDIMQGAVGHTDNFTKKRLAEILEQLKAL